MITTFVKRPAWSARLTTSYASTAPADRRRDAGLSGVTGSTSALAELLGYAPRHVTSHLHVIGTAMELPPE